MSKGIKGFQKGHKHSDETKKKIPISREGCDCISNIIPACKNCNSKKHNKIIYENPELIKKGDTNE